MRSPSLVKDLCLSMRDGAGGDTPITVKCRIGVDNDDSYEQLAAFVDEVRYVNGNEMFDMLRLRAGGRKGGCCRWSRYNIHGMQKSGTQYILGIIALL